ncbi:MAG: HD domain-containing protein [Oligoflexia bacterium]|nr:HD domain-containing protein [Oligoflexia bacterium]
MLNPKRLKLKLYTKQAIFLQLLFCLLMSFSFSAHCSTEDSTVMEALKLLAKIKNRTLDLPILHSIDFQSLSFEELAEKLYQTKHPDAYTDLTDHIHYRDVLKNAYKFANIHGVKMTPAIEMAALFHDIDRWFYPLTVPKLKSDIMDETVRKKVIHPLNSARIAQLVMQSARMPSELIENVVALILYHDVERNAPVTLTLSEAKEVEFYREHFDLDFSPKELPVTVTILGAVPNDLYLAHSVICDADAVNFFQRTYKFFFLDQIVAKGINKNNDKRYASFKKVLERTKNNYRRLSPAARKVVDEIMKQNEQHAKSKGVARYELWAIKVYKIAITEQSLSKTQENLLYDSLLKEATHLHYYAEKFGFIPKQSVLIRSAL